MSAGRDDIRSALLGLAGLLLSGCGGCGKSSVPADAGTDAPRPAVGRLPIDPDWANLVPEPYAGFTACHEPMAPAMTNDEAIAKRRAWRPRAHSPSLRAQRGVVASREAKALVFRGVGAPASRVALDSWAASVETSRTKLLGELSTSNVEWESFYADVLAGVLPKDAFVAYAGESAWRESSTFTGLAVRFYVVAGSARDTARTLAKEGRATLEEVACAFEEGHFHRNAWRLVATDARVTLSGSVFYDDYGGGATVDLRIVDGVAGGALVVACMYEDDAHAKRCDALAASAR